MRLYSWVQRGWSAAEQAVGVFGLGLTPRKYLGQGRHGQVFVGRGIAGAEDAAVKLTVLGTEARLVRLVNALRRDGSPLRGFPRYLGDPIDVGVTERRDAVGQDRTIYLIAREFVAPFGPGDFSSCGGPSEELEELASATSEYKQASSWDGREAARIEYLGACDALVPYYPELAASLRELMMCDDAAVDEVTPANLGYVYDEKQTEPRVVLFDGAAVSP